MNQKLIVLLLTMIIALVACSDDQPTDSEVTAKDKETEAEQEKSASNESNESQPNQNGTQESVDQSDFQPATEVELTEASEPSNLEEFIEMDRLLKEIDIDSYTLHVIIDHPGKRVIIFTNDEKQLYKSVYVKRNALLKLIDLQKNKPVIVEEIQ
ncbi:hypothetical protein ACFFJI_04065 [Allobacillus sp. GCM10007491]|uniref:Lipoprotein n=1 Tax=Allobacillus saliphilus TaxID=2912308 RepID=A0A941CXJ7_9BACI|nr:hypothetical protein [Allobacillus saliphilus]MBR7553950.1 hypothetical protein [Allobacillus saliphilus]